MMTSTVAQIESIPFRSAEPGDAQVVSLSGYMDNDECERVAGELAKLLKQGHKRVILDCSAVTFITSAGFARLFVKAQHFRRHRGVVQLAGLRALKRKLAEAEGFDPATELLPGLDTALDAIPQPGRGQPKQRKKVLKGGPDSAVPLRIS